MKKITISVAKVIIIKLFVFILLCTFSKEVLSKHQSEGDSLEVFLDKSKLPLHVTLIISNNYSQKIAILAEFKDLYWQWEPVNGINIRTYSNGDFFRLRNYQATKTSEYIKITEERFIFIDSLERKEFVINLEQFFNGIKTNHLGAVFDVNLTYVLLSGKKDEKPMFLRTETNFIEVKPIDD